MWRPPQSRYWISSCHLLWTSKIARRFHYLSLVKRKDHTERAVKKKSMEAKLSYYPTNQLLMCDHLPQNSGESHTHCARAYLSLPCIIWEQGFIPPPWYKCDSNQKPPHQATGLHLAIYTLQKVSKHTLLYRQQEWCRKSYFSIVTQDYNVESLTEKNNVLSIHTLLLKCALPSAA